MGMILRWNTDHYSCQFIQYINSCNGKTQQFSVIVILNTLYVLYYAERSPFLSVLIEPFYYSRHFRILISNIKSRIFLNVVNFFRSTHESVGSRVETCCSYLLSVAQCILLSRMPCHLNWRGCFINKKSENVCAPLVW